MHSTFAISAVLFSALQLATAQTFTDCNPTEKTCPGDAALGTTLVTDFTKGKSSDWSLADGTSISYGSQGAEFVIAKSTDAPTISSEKYIMFGKVDVTMRACPGTGTVSSFILESDDLDEIDWEWLGSTDTSVESNFFGKGNTTTYDRAIYHPVSSPIENFVTYSIEWTSEAITWAIGGNTVRTLPYADALTLGGKNYPQTPMRIKMGNWVGCADAAAASNPATQGTCEWAGGYLDLSQGGPFTMYVQSVTIQDYGDCTGEYTYGDLSGSYQSITCGGKSVSSSSGSSSGSSSATGSSSGSASASASASASTTSGGVLVETSSSAANSSSTSSSAAASTTDASATTTLSKTTSTGSSSQAKATGANSTTSSGLAQTTSSDASTLAPKHKYGLIDLSVMVLGLGVGYLVM